MRGRRGLKGGRGPGPPSRPGSRLRGAFLRLRGGGDESDGGGGGGGLGRRRWRVRITRKRGTTWVSCALATPGGQPREGAGARSLHPSGLTGRARAAGLRGGRAAAVDGRPGDPERGGARNFALGHGRLPWTQEPGVARVGEGVGLGAPRDSRPSAVRERGARGARVPPPAAPCAPVTRRSGFTREVCPSKLCES